MKKILVLLTVVAIVFCVVRGLPVMIEAKRVIEG